MDFYNIHLIDADGFVSNGADGCMEFAGKRAAEYNARENLAPGKRIVGFLIKNVSQGHEFRVGLVGG